MGSKSHIEVEKPPEQREIPKAGDLSLRLQESAIIEDLLFAMMGIEGVYITMARLPKLPRDQNAKYIHRKFKTDESLDPSLRDLVSKILPLASIYMSLEAFTEQHSQFEYGFVNHGLCAAIRSLLKEYLILIAQLEHQFRTSPDFTLQKLWYYIQPTLQTLSSLDLLADVIREKGIREPPKDDLEALLMTNEGVPLGCKGGGILAIIAGGMYDMSGDPGTKKLYGFLLNKASVSYIGMLESWIHKGTIHDPYDEFMIVTSSKVSKAGIEEDFNDAYWEQRYTIREGYVPSFLAPHKTKILLAGKYLNVIKECGIHLSNSANGQTRDPSDQAGSSNHVERNDVLAALSGGNLIDSIDAAYQYANRQLLDLLLNKEQLLGRLRSMKRYFFLDQSDYFTHFLDLAADELKRPWREMSLTKLQSLMDLVLRNPSSVTVNDAFKEDLKVDTSSHGLVEQLILINSIQGQTQGQEPSFSRPWQDETVGSAAMEGIMATSLDLPSQKKRVLLGIESLTLDYSITFPLSLVISRKALTKYQLLFRHLLYLKHGEQVLSNSWTDHTKSPEWKQASHEVKHWCGRVYRLRAKMLAFVQQFTYYACYEVLEPNWNDMVAKLAKVSTVDEVLQIHSDFLDTCLNQCMLTNSKLLKLYSKLMSTCIRFAKYSETFTGAVNAMNATMEESMDKAVPPSQTEKIQKAMQRLNEFEDGFIYHMKFLIEALNLFGATETVRFVCLVVRLDYNQFYANQNLNENLFYVAQFSQQQQQQQ
ncbi:Spc98 family-domain-containing protein [Mortierella sp. GBAus27b]|nr:Spc98 family-domain-containing protein [Mortierella sp. GBAus27b]